MFEVTSKDNDYAPNLGAGNLDGEQIGSVRCKANRLAAEQAATVVYGETSLFYEGNKDPAERRATEGVLSYPGDVRGCNHQ